MILYLSVVAVVMSGAEAAFSQVSVMKIAYGVWVVMVSQSSVVCFPSERVLISMQLSSPVAWMLVSLGGELVEVWPVVSSMLQVKQQLQQVNGPLVVRGEAGRICCSGIRGLGREVHRGCIVGGREAGGRKAGKCRADVWHEQG